MLSETAFGKTKAQLRSHLERQKSLLNSLFKVYNQAAILQWLC